MWLLHFYMKESTSSALHTRLASTYEARTRAISTRKTAMLTTYPQVVNYLLRTYATDEKIVDIADEVLSFILPLNKTPSQY